eukprot:14356458-Alexandrium_andersonii.AAC.1
MPLTLCSSSPVMSKRCTGAEREVMTAMASMARFLSSEESLAHNSVMTASAWSSSPPLSARVWCDSEAMCWTRVP